MRDDHAVELSDAIAEEDVESGSEDEFLLIDDTTSESDDESGSPDSNAATLAQKKNGEACRPVRRQVNFVEDVGKTAKRKRVLQNLPLNDYFC